MRKGLVCLAIVALFFPAGQALAVRNEAHERLKKLSDKDRNAALSVIVRANGDPCTVTKNFIQGEPIKEGNAFWNVRCSNGKAFSIMIEPDAKGSTRVLDCAIMEELHMSNCFKTFSAQDK